MNQIYLYQLGFIYSTSESDIIFKKIEEIRVENVVIRNPLLFPFTPNFAQSNIGYPYIIIK